MSPEPPVNPSPVATREAPGLRCRGRDVDLSQPRLMAIVNINHDSFSHDGSLDLDDVWRQAMQRVDEGACFIDIGAESARTNRPPIPWQEEVGRLLPFVDRWNHWIQGQPEDRRPLLSINTWRPQVIEAVLPRGGDLINDMSGLAQPDNAALCARHDAALLIMHTVGEPKQAHLDTTYPDLMAELDRFFRERIEVATAAGLSRQHLLLDPGIDFAKQRDDNLLLLRNLDRLRDLGRPLLLPISRKTVIGEVLGIDDPRQRDAGTLACLVAGLAGGASVFRVHNVRAAADALKVLAPVHAGPAGWLERG